MAVDAKVEVLNLKQVLKEVRELDPELRRQFAKDVRKITLPLVNAAKNKYAAPRIPSGFARVWAQGGRQLFPYNTAEAQRGIKTKVSTAKKNNTVIGVTQKNPAAAILEFAQNPTSFSSAATYLFGGNPGRVMWAAADQTLGQVTSELVDAVNLVSGSIERKVAVL